VFKKGTVTLRNLSVVVGVVVVLGSDNGWVDYVLDTGCNNLGYNPQGFFVSTPCVAASGTDVTNTLPFPVRIYILTIGTTTAYQVTDPSGTAQAITTVLQAGQEITLDSGAKIRFTYIVAPTWKRYGT
jgi:hypothetical protein